MDEKKLHQQEIRDKLAGKVIHIIPYMHPDWAWCHTRIWHEMRYAASMEENVDLAETMPDYRFYMDSWVTLMVPFIEKCPEKIDGLKRAVKAGKIAVCGTFSNVRPNMVDGEAFIRNMVIGRRLWSEMFPGVEQSVHADMVDVALGHPQLPQLLAKAGYRYFRAGRPFELMWRLGFPRRFNWKGLDGSSVLLWWGEYYGITFPENIEKIMVEDWTQSVENMYELELKKVAETVTGTHMDIHQGSDDSLPLKAFNTDNYIDLPGFIAKWNRNETSAMRFSTPVEFFHALETEPGIQTVEGTLDICDVSYNVAWGGETGLVAKRIQGSELLSAAERMSACACFMGVMGWKNTTELWKDNLTASAHASQWLFDVDMAEVFEKAQRPITFAREQLNKMAKAMLRRIRLPRNAIISAFNPFGQKTAAPFVFTVTCGQIDELLLADGNGHDLPFQIVKSYEYTDSVWEYDIIVMLALPAHGWNTVMAKQGRIDCRVGGEFAPVEVPGEITLGSDVKFSLSNGLLELQFTDGDITGVTDLDSGTAVNPAAVTPWNQVEYQHIDTSKGFLHCGPIISRSAVRWETARVLEQGPVRWKVRLQGAIGKDAYVQDVWLHAGEKKMFFSTEMQCNGDLEGYVTFSIPGNGETLSGGINFGMEKKAVLQVTYYTDDDPDANGKEGRAPVADPHRQRDGLFFAKDFACYESGGHRVSLSPRLGDRYYLHDRESGALAYIHMGTTLIYPGTCERNINPDMLHGKGRHVFEDMVVIGSSDESTSVIQNAAYAYRLPPVAARPVFHNTYEAPLPPTGSLLSVSAANVQISAAFPEGDALMVRLWESTGQETETCLTLPGTVLGVTVEDFIGNMDLSAMAIVDNGAIRLTLRPWEIMTLRCEMA